MTDAELIAYFENTELPEMLRVDRATKQYELPKHASHYINLLKQRPEDKNFRFWLLKNQKSLRRTF
jgi:hypothetical protein